MDDEGGRDIAAPAILGEAPLAEALAVAALLAPAESHCDAPFVARWALGSGEHFKRRYCQRGKNFSRDEQGAARRAGGA